MENLQYLVSMLFSTVVQFSQHVCYQTIGLFLREQRPRSPALSFAILQSV